MSVKIEAEYSIKTDNFGHVDVCISIEMHEKFENAELHKMVARIKQAAINVIQRDDTMTTHERNMQKNALQTKKIT
jgi:hypothetical protein